MRRVLVLAYYFPPLGGAGVQRTVKFLRHLPELGYGSVVVTGPDARDLDWSPADGTLASELPAGLEVIRIQGPEPPRSDGWRGRAERWGRRETPFARWWTEGVVDAGLRRAREADLIYASMSPFETGPAAAALARATGRPWVADLRDPWALDEWLVYPTRLHRRLELRQMRRVLRSAAAIVANTPEARAQILSRIPELSAAQVVTIPNGYDERDFAGPPPTRSDGRFRIVHAGYVHSSERAAGSRLRGVLGGAVPGLRIDTRSHLYLLRALETIFAARPELRSVVEVHLAGVLSEADRAALPDGLVTAHGYLPHGATVELVRSADLLFLPMHDLPPGVRARIVPGKTYEYLATGRPILAAVPDGDARDVLASAGTALVCRPSDVGEMAALIEAQIDRWQRGETPPTADPEVVSAFERRRLAGRLATVFDELPGAAARATAASRRDARQTANAEPGALSG